MKLARKWSIGQKLNFIVLATTFTALLIAGIALVAFDLRSKIRIIEHDLVTQADIIGLSSSTALAFDDQKVAGENLRVLRANPNLEVAALYTPQGRLFALFRSDGSDGYSVVPQIAQPEHIDVDWEWVRVWRPVLSDKETVGMVFLQSRHDLAWRVMEYLGVLGLILTVSLVAALLLSNRLHSVVTGPILAIGQVARQIRQGPNFALRAVKTSDDEIGVLVDLFNAMLDELGQRARTLGQANQALRESDERYQLAVRGSSAGLWDWDLISGTTFYSPRFKALLGYSTNEFPDLPSSLANVMHDEDRPAVREALRAHIADDKPYQVECRLRLKCGEWRWFLIAGMVRKDSHGTAFRMAGSVIDVTERKLAEQVLQEANRAKDEFIATMAHELRNPLAPIRTGLEILKVDAGNGPPSQRAREMMERQLLHLIRLVDDLLDISRISSGKIHLETRRVNLASVVESSIETTRPTIESRGHTLEIDLPSRGIELMADPTRLAQALANLLNNAAKYTPAGGRIRILAWQDGATARVEVSDNGVGIPAEMLEKVFSMFTQVGRTLDNSQGGLGIGLYLVRSLIALHGGSVTAASAGPGQGSAFTVSLPALPARRIAPVPAPPPASALAADASGSRILVVDDNVDAAETLAMVLEMTGHQTRSVHDGTDVLAAAADFTPDVILLDIGLPGMSGYDVARQLRCDPRFAQTRLIAVTGWGSDGDREHAREAGFDGHLTKPVEISALQPLLGAARMT